MKKCLSWVLLFAGLARASAVDCPCWSSEDLRAHLCVPPASYTTPGVYCQGLDAASCQQFTVVLLAEPFKFDLFEHDPVVPVHTNGVSAIAWLGTARRNKVCTGNGIEVSLDTDQYAACKAIAEEIIALATEYGKVAVGSAGSQYDIVNFHFPDDACSVEVDQPSSTGADGSGADGSSEDGSYVNSALSASANSLWAFGTLALATRLP